MVTILAGSQRKKRVDRERGTTGKELRKEEEMLHSLARRGDVWGDGK
jgi:hypothetical protein